VTLDVVLNKVGQNPLGKKNSAGLPAVSAGALSLSAWHPQRDAGRTAAAASRADLLCVTGVEMPAFEPRKDKQDQRDI
jgi:hypothetical protein